ncbi:MAG: hypothetical protein DRI61_15360, partial [Chloroflexi bacterium]
ERLESETEATYKNPRAVFDSDKGWVVKATSLNPGREETIAEVIGVVPSEKSYSIILATDKIPLENRDNQNGGERVSFQNRENEAIVADNSREIVLQNGGRVENVNYQSERNGEKLDNSQRAPPQIVFVKKIDTNSFLQSSNLLPSDINTNSIHIYEVKNNNGEAPRYIASYDYKGEKVLLGVGYNGKGEVEIGVSRESLIREIGKYEIRSSYKTAEDLAEAIEEGKVNREIGEEVLLEKLSNEQLKNAFKEGKVSLNGREFILGDGNVIDEAKRRILKGEINPDFWKDAVIEKLREGRISKWDAVVLSGKIEIKIKRGEKGEFDIEIPEEIEKAYEEGVSQAIKEKREVLEKMGIDVEKFKKELIESGVRADFIRSENFNNFIKQPGIEEIWKWDMKNFEEAAKRISQNIEIREDNNGKRIVEIKKDKLDENAKKLLGILKGLKILSHEGEREETKLINVFDYISYFLPQKVNLKELGSVVETVIISLRRPYTLYKPEFTENGEIKDARGKTEIAIPATLMIFNEMGVKMTGIFAEPSEARRVFGRVFEILKERLRERGGEEWKIEEGKIGELETISFINEKNGKKIEFVLFSNEKAREEKVLTVDAKQLKDKIILTDIHTLQHIEMERIRGDKQARELSSEIYKRGIVVDEIHQVSQAPFLIIGFNGRSLREYFGERKYKEFVEDVETVEKMFGKLLEGDWKGGEKLLGRYIKKESLEPTEELWRIFAEEFGINYKDFVSSEKYEDKRALIKAFARNLFMKEEYEGGFGFKYRYDKEKGEGYYIVCPVHLFQI